MTRLPRVNGKDLIRALQRCGFFIDRQKGSHVILAHQDDPTRFCVVPLHGSKTIKPGTLQSILKGAKLSADELIDLL